MTWCAFKYALFLLWLTINNGSGLYFITIVINRFSSTLLRFLDYIVDSLIFTKAAKTKRSCCVFWYKKGRVSKIETKKIRHQLCYIYFFFKSNIEKYWKFIEKHLNRVCIQKKIMWTFIKKRIKTPIKCILM